MDGKVLVLTCVKIIDKFKNNNLLHSNEFSSCDHLKTSLKTKNDFFKSLIDHKTLGHKDFITFIKKKLNLTLNLIFISHSKEFQILNNNSFQYASIVNLDNSNDIRYINKFFENVNKNLLDSGLYYGKAETFQNRRNAKLKKYSSFVNWFIYVFDMLFKRILPKLPITKKIYFSITKGKARVMSKAEIFGRLYSCGFEIVEEVNINNILFFVAKKIKEPFFDKNPTYGPIITLNRVGKGKKLFKVYKLRTMHPYAEYLQEYVYQNNNLKEGGKIKDDFRISPEGNFFRKFWLDEIPMILNIFKGNMKLVGVRPLSPHFFSLYDEDLQNLRTKFKPGLIPPFYVDLPNTIEEIMLSEKRYLEEYSISPFKTDLKYFFLSFKNIVMHGARSS